MTLLTRLRQAAVVVVILLASSAPMALSAQNLVLEDPYVDLLVTTYPNPAKSLFFALGVFGRDDFQVVGPGLSQTPVQKFNDTGLKPMVEGGDALPRLAIVTPEGRLQFDLQTASRTPDGVIQWTGVSKADLSVAVLAIRDGQIVGTINKADGSVTYISPTGLFERHQVAEVPAEATGRGEDAVDTLVPPPLDGPEISEDDPGQCDTGGSPGLPKAIVVRILVVYSKAAARDSPGIQLEAAQLIAEVNRVWTTAHFTVGAELAHVTATDYVEGVSQTVDLEALRAGRGGLSGVAALRDTYKADLVALITVTGSGLAYTLENPSGYADYGFSVSNRTMARDSKTLIHELGHNLGMLHDRDTYGGGLSTKYSYGYVAKVARLRDIMAYPAPCQNCPRVLSYSTPNFVATTLAGSEPLGRALGLADAAYAVEIMCRNAATVSAYR